jgi:uncharacterized protein
VIQVSTFAALTRRADYRRVRNMDRGTVVATEVRLAAGYFSRLFGLLLAKPLRPGEGLLLTPCHSVHMYGMRFPIDVAFLDRAGRVVAAYPHLRPGRRTAWHKAAVAALELPAGALDVSQTSPGDVLTWTSHSEP